MISKRTTQTMRLAACGALVLTTSAFGQLVPRDVARLVKDATGVDLNALPEVDVPAHLQSDEFNLVQLRKQDLVRLDNPAIKVPLDLDLIQDPPPLIDKRDFRVLRSDDYEPGTVYVRFKPGVDEARGRGAHEELGTSVEWRSPLVPGLCRVRLPDGLEMAASVNAYLDMDDVLYAEPAYRVRPTDVWFDDPLYLHLWGLSSTFGGTWACDAWGDSYAGSLVAIIDSGTDIDHPDLVDNIWVNPGEIPGNGVDDDGNGYIDDVHGWNVAQENGDVDACGDSHGTHVAGTVSARGNNGIGVLGVSPFGKMMILRCNMPVGAGNCHPGGGTDDCCGLFGTPEGVTYAIANGARVSNNSYGGYSFSQAMYDTIQSGQAANHLFVASAGNDTNNNDVNPHYPDGYDLSNIISVAAVETDGELATFSNYGPTSVDIGAPGTSITSTVDGGGYEFGWQGTSMASPHVAGAASLILGAYPELTWGQVKSMIIESHIGNGHLNGLVVTGGHLDAQRPLGQWVDPAWGGAEFGSFYKPFRASSTQSAHNSTPWYGVLNFKPGSIPAAEVNFVWNRRMTLRARGGTVVLGE